MGVRWRLLREERGEGVYFRLQKGRARDRVGLVLGYVTADDAERARVQVQREEDAGSVGRVLRLYARERADAVRYLCGDPAVDAVIGPPEPDYGSMKLREYYATVYAPARATERPRSWPSEERHWVRVLEGLGDVRLRSVDEFVLADHLDGLQVTRGERKGKAASGTTKRLHRAALQALLKRAYRHRHIPKMPDLSVFRIEGATKSVRAKPDPLTLDELVRLMEAATEPKHRALFAVGAGQGLRPSELIALDWSDVDWNVPSMRVRGTKTEASASTIPITPLALRELKKWWVRRRRPIEGIVFPSDTDEGRPYSSSTAYRTALEASARRAKLGRDVYPYLLRDSFATIAWTVGIDKDVARRVLRHTDERMLDRVYCRPRPADLVPAVAAFDR